MREFDRFCNFVGLFPSCFQYCWVFALFLFVGWLVGISVIIFRAC